jgi:tRNA threonylcarbamoyladenosine biosynthesis protein TsaE
MQPNPKSELVLESLDQAEQFGKLLGSLCRPGDVICLDGDLGAGKTTLTQSIAKGIGVDAGEYITSPTFAVFHQYNGRLKLYHMDFYRLYDSDDVISMGLEEYFYLGGVTVIEWFRIALDIIPREHLLLELEIAGEQSRRIRCTSPSDAWIKRIEILMV